MRCVLRGDKKGAGDRERIDPMKVKGGTPDEFRELLAKSQQRFTRQGSNSQLSTLHVDQFDGLMPVRTRRHLSESIQIVGYE